MDDCIRLQQNHLNLEKRESGWKMEYNTSKCNVLHITRKCHPYVHVYKLKGQVLDPVHSVKYLSVDLRWNDHIKTTSNKGKKTLGLLKRNLILFCPPKTKETAYKALLRPNSGILFICVGFTYSCDGRFFHFRKTSRVKRELGVTILLS